MIEIKNTPTIVTHAGRPHIDDTLAVSLMLSEYPTAWIKRVPHQWQAKDRIDTIAIDVGGSYSEGVLNFDHHHDKHVRCSLALVRKYLKQPESALEVYLDYKDRRGQPAAAALGIYSTDRLSAIWCVERRILGLLETWWNSNCEEGRKIVGCDTPYAVIGETIENRLLDYDTLINTANILERKYPEAAKAAKAVEAAAESDRLADLANVEDLCKINDVLIGFVAPDRDKGSYIPLKETGYNYLIRKDPSSGHVKMYADTEKGADVSRFSKAFDKDVIIFSHPNGFLMILDLPHARVMDIVYNYATS